MTERRHLPWLLGALLLFAQLVLAWHTPSHIDEHFSHAQSVQECQLGAQAHAPALPGQCLILPVATSKPFIATHETSSHLAAADSPFLARGPPTC